ncbi:MAG: hypothetical protein D6693_09435 [Planctomycetota bacterium]|nr:MAG: hypothetical protein D6693_09435 [Planctomycetota bacterium]
MSGSSDPSVSDIVARFFQRRQSGERVSIDDVLETLDVPDAAGARAEALSRIARQSATRLSQGRTLDQSDGADSDPDAAWSDLPEIEGYDLIDMLGKGGMGVVYEAYQRSTGRRVAIKVMLGTAAASETGRRRFEREVELIARLQHPGVVSIIDSGVHKRRWFYVMEYVDGVPLDEALTPGECDPREALEVVARVCDAVEYAHQRGVLHRDLKPSNILLDAMGQPRLLDFGLAKSFDPQSKMGLDVSLSEPGQILGTLAFMPPEQSRGRYDEISARTDVYSLGAIAYELITGRLPCAMEGSLSEILRRIEEVDPAAPSSLRPGLSRDVDAVLLKALEKAPEGRYASPAELAEDIRRFLSDRPVRARRTGPVARAGRWMRRNRLATRVGAVALVVVVVVSALAAVKIVGAYRARLDQSELQEQTAAWLSQTLAQLSPDSGYFQQTMTLEQQNDAHAARLASDPPAREEVAAAVHSFVGRNYLQLRAFDKAERHDRAAVEILRRAHRAPHPDLAEAIHNLAAALWWKGEYANAEPLYREALAMRRELFGPDSLEVADTTNHLAACLDRLDRDDEAERLYREALRIRRAALAQTPGDREPIAASLNNLGTFLLSRGEAEQAEPIFRESLGLIESLRGPDDRRVGAVLTNLAECLTDQNRPDEAEPLLRRAIEIYTLRLGDDNTSLAMALYELARVHAARGSWDEARGEAARSLAIRRRKLPAGHPLISDSLELLGLAALKSGDPDAAEGALRECLTLRQGATQRRPAGLIRAGVSLAVAVDDRDPEEARALLDEAFDLARDSEGRSVERAIRECARLLREMGRSEDAGRFEALLDSV